MLTLPFVLDIAIGLIFVYISLSLIASEIQEIISTLFEFRAKHLKTSIKYLLIGSDVDSVEEIKQTKQLIDELYSNPLIKNLNHQGQGAVSSLLKRNKLLNFGSSEKIENLKNQLIEKVEDIESIQPEVKDTFKQEIKKIPNTKQKESLEISKLKIKEKFNKLLIEKIDENDQNTRYKLIEIREKLLENSALPSYIPSETFATTLLEVLKIPTLIHYLSCNKFKGLVKKLIEKLSEIQDMDEENASKFVEAMKEIYNDFYEKKYTLEISLLRIKTKLGELIITFENKDSDNGENYKKLVEKLRNIENTFFEDKNFKIICQEMKLNLVYVAKILDPDFLKWDSDKKAKILEQTDNNQNNNALINKFNKGTEQNQQLQEEIEYILSKLPATLKDSIVTLAHRAQTKVETTGKDIEQFSKEIEIWFNNSMERASGVYKRNAKGLALIISFVIAFVANADSFHIISRLSTDEILRDALVKSAEVLETTCQSNDSFDCIKSTTKQNLEELSLPIGWSCINFEQQAGFRFPILCKNTKNNQVASSNYVVRILKVLKTFIGLLISTVAISMGASFWFDLLSKLVNVRNTGSKPKSAVPETEKLSKTS
ncbi:MAG: hypothetical protein QNJ37_05280 [Crocosphaera sp.]|nr:hypothetical protein [Crocosphaera sp.]